MSIRFFASVALKHVPGAVFPVRQKDAAARWPGFSVRRAFRRNIEDDLHAGRVRRGAKRCDSVVQGKSRRHKWAHVDSPARKEIDSRLESAAPRSDDRDLVDNSL